MDWGRFLLDLFPLSLLVFAFNGGSFRETGFAGRPWLMSIEFALLGCLSDLSPMTASSPVSEELGLSPGDFGVSLDQNAHVEPAAGFGPGSEAAGGASLIATSPLLSVSTASEVSGGSELSLGGSEAVVAYGTQLRLNQLAARWSVVSVLDAWSFAVVSCAGSSGSASLGGSKAGVAFTSDGFSGVSGARENQPPSQPDDVVGLSGISAAGGASGIDVSVSLLSVVGAAAEARSSFVPVTFPALFRPVSDSADEDCVSAGVVSCNLLGALTEA